MATFGQLHDILGVLANRVSVDPNSPWGRLDTQRVQNQVIQNPDFLANAFISFIGNDARLIVGELKRFVIDRSVPFDPVKFIGNGWSIWRGPKDGKGLEGDEQQDSRSLALAEIDLSALVFEHCLKDKESSVTGETKLVRLQKNHSQLIRSDARIAQALWEEPEHRTLEWIRVNFRKTWFDFPGTEIRRPGGRRGFLCLCWGGGEWDWGIGWLGGGWSSGYPSLLLANQRSNS